ncbi:unnamed protein product, partial [Medioppia subpectinata]
MPIDINYSIFVKAINGETEDYKETFTEPEISIMRIWLVANDSHINGIIEPGGENLRYIFHMDTNTDTNFDFNTKPYSDILANDLVANVIKGEKVGTYRHLKLPNGHIPMGPEKLYPDCLLGFEYVGRRADTGERVMGLEFGRMFCNSVNVIDKYMSSIPEHWSMAEAVTVLSTYSTVHYGLIKRATLRKGESVLIHSGAGGVGQAAINVCKHYECDIYATVETDKKKQFLINTHNIPENRIFISTDLHFNDEIMDATDGQGVDVVFNSLMGEKLSTSFECLAISGRFVQIGRYDTIDGKQLPINDSIRDIQFTTIFMDYVIMNDSHYLDDFDGNQKFRNRSNECNGSPFTFLVPHLHNNFPDVFTACHITKRFVRILGLKHLLMHPIIKLVQIVAVIHYNVIHKNCGELYVTNGVIDWQLFSVNRIISSYLYESAANRQTLKTCAQFLTHQ